MKAEVVFINPPEALDFIEFVLGKQKNPVYEYVKKNFPARS